MTRAVTVLAWMYLAAGLASRALAVHPARVAGSGADIFGAAASAMLGIGLLRRYLIARQAVLLLSAVGLVLGVAGLGLCVA